MSSIDDSYDPYLISTLDERRETNSNTWGFSRKIGEHTFGDYHWETGYHYSGEPGNEWSGTQHTNTWNIADNDREKFRNSIRVLTKILDIGGYIPGIAFLAGVIRIVAASILGRSVETNIAAGVFCGKLAEEARRTYKAQIARGVLEIIPVLGTVINLSLDAYWYNQWGKKPVENLN